MASIAACPLCIACQPTAARGAAPTHRMLSGPRHLPATRMPRRLQAPRRLACRAERRQGSSESDSEGGQDFATLAGTVAGKLASDLAGKEGALNNLKTWLEDVSRSPPPQQQGVEETAGDAGTGADKQQGEGVLHKAGRLAADFFVVGKKQGGDTRLPILAAHYLGVDSLDAVDALKNWLNSAASGGGAAQKPKDASKMVGALVYHLLMSFERSTGESFEGREHQYKWLSHLAQEVLGSTLTAGVVKSLVEAYLRVPGVKV